MLADYVRIIAKGQGGARPLTREEADSAMQIILRGEAAPEALGAFLMVLRYRGETPDEIAGFASALRAFSTRPNQTGDLDWPSYAAGRTRGAPLFLLAAKLVAKAGHRVVLHGWNSHQSPLASVRDALPALDIPIDASDAPITYLPLETLSPQALDLIRLRDTFGLRSCINTVLRIWNPCNAPASVQGVFHPSYRDLQAQAGDAIGSQTVTVIKGGSGEFERHPGKPVELFTLRSEAQDVLSAPALVSGTRRLHEPQDSFDLPALWSGAQSDPFAQAVITGTAALALWTLGKTETPQQADALASNIWAARHSSERIDA